MRRLLVILLAFLLSLNACRQSNSPVDSFALEPGDLWIRDVTVVSPERPDPLPGAHVVIRHGRIRSVTTRPPAGPVDGVTVAAGTGKYLVPGFIDGHVHLAGVPGMTPEHEAAMPALVNAYYEQLPRSYLYFGFTTLVDLNVVDPEPIERMRATDIAPEVFDCGNALALANGYPMVYLPPGERFERYPNFLDDPRQRRDIPAKFAPERHSPEAAVARVADGGGRCVKAFYEPGFGAFAGELPVPPLELMQRVREAAHLRGLPLLLHANSVAAHHFAARLKADVVVHGLWNWEEEGAGSVLPDRVRQVLAEERDSGVAMMPTLRVIGGLADILEPSFLEDPQLRRVLPARLVEWYGTDEGQWFSRATMREFRGLSASRAHAILLALQAAGQRAAAHFATTGGRIVFGSDTPSAPTFANPPGYNGYLELRDLERAVGLSPRQVLAASTLENATLFDLTADYGTIEPGKVASLLVLTSDPLVSTAAFDSIETVIVKGRIVPRAALLANQP